MSTSGAETIAVVMSRHRYRDTVSNLADAEGGHFQAMQCPLQRNCKYADRIYAACGQRFSSEAFQYEDVLL